MRITNSIISQTSLANVQRNLRDMYKAQESVTSGKKINRPSDDPLGSNLALQSRTSIRAIDQYSRGINTANSRAAAEESVLDQITDILTRVKQLSVAAGSDTVNATQRKQAAIEIDELFKEAVNLANTKYREGYLFGGTGPNAQPYAVTQTGADYDFTSTSPTGTLQIQVSDTNFIPANHNGTEVFEDTGVLASIRDIATAFRSGTRDQITSAMGSLDTAFEGVQNLLSAVGSRVASLQITGANLDALSASFEVLKSDVEDVEIEEAITELMARQTSYQAALMTTSRIMGLSLADYMR